MSLEEAILNQLEIIDAATSSLRAMLTGGPTSTIEDGDICPHPEAERLDAGSLVNPNAWKCGLCGEMGGQRA